MRRSLDGMTYHVRARGDGPPLLLLHGFTGSSQTWDPFLARFAARFRVLAVDLPGHGRTDAPRDPERYAAERLVADLVALLDALDAPRARVLGYSLGGRLALHLAVTAPERVAALVLESASPGIAEPDQRATRVREDEALANDLEHNGIQAFVDRWERLPLWASQARLPAAERARLRAQRLAQRPEGLANSLRGFGAGRPRPLHSELGRLTMPVLVLAGADDERYVTVGRAMAAGIPNARFDIVPEAGHAVHLEQPGRFAKLALDFLTSEIQTIGAGGRTP